MNAVQDEPTFNNVSLRRDDYMNMDEQKTNQTA